METEKRHSVLLRFDCDSVCTYYLLFTVTIYYLQLLATIYNYTIHSCFLLFTVNLQIYVIRLCCYMCEPLKKKKRKEKKKEKKREKKKKLMHLYLKQ